MVGRSAAVLGLAGTLVVGAGVWSLYQRATTDEVPYTVVGRVGDDVDLRRYPPTVLAETVAPTEAVAFRRLFRYIDGGNDGGVDIAMTAPVAVRGRGTSVPMTAPVEVGRGRTASTVGHGGTDDHDRAVRMAFSLPATYDLDGAPHPTDSTVGLVAVPERTLAVHSFSGRATDARVARETRQLLSALEPTAVVLAGDPFFLGYDAPWTLPFLRRNEVAVEVAAAD